MGQGEKRTKLCHPASYKMDGAVTVTRITCMHWPLLKTRASLISISCVISPREDSRNSPHKRILILTLNPLRLI